MAKLTGQTIADSYDQLLIVDAASGISASLQAIEAGDTGGSASSLKISTSKCEVIPASDSTSLFEVSQADGTAVLSVDTTNVRVGIGTAIPGVINTADIDGGATSGLLHIKSNVPGIVFEDSNISSDADYNMRVTADQEKMKFSSLLYDGGTVADLMTIEADTGNVGIGITAPEVELHISGANNAATAAGNLVIDSSSDVDDDHGDKGGSLSFGGVYHNNGARTEFAGISGRKANDTSNNYDGYLAFHSRANGAALFEAMRIDKTGNVGIGNTAPGTPLEVSTSADDANIRASAWSTTDAHSAAILLSKSASATINTLAATAAGERLGTIEAHGVNTSGDREAATQIRFEGDAAPDGDSVPGRIVFLTSDLDDAGTPTERMRIDDAGNVGIGTTAPASNLHISGSASAGNAEIELWADAGAQAEDRWKISALDHATRDNLEIYNYNGSAWGTALFAIEGTTGKVGIGTNAPGALLNIQVVATTASTPLEALRVSVADTGGVELAAGHGPSIDFYVPDGSSSVLGARLAVVKENASDTSHEAAMTFYTQNTGTPSEKMRIDKDGKVGIGTVSPGNKLTVDAEAVGDGIDIIDGDITHGMTGYLPTDAVLRLTTQHATEGGGRILGATENTGQHGLTIYGLCPDSPTATLNNIQLIGAQADSTNVQAVAAAKQVLQVKNYTTALMTILGNGNVGIGTAGPSYQLQVAETDAATYGIWIDHSDTDARGLKVKYAQTPNNHDDEFFIHCQDGTAARMYVSSIGNVENVTGTAIAAISDGRMKENIADYTGGLAIVNALKPRTFTWKTSVDRGMTGTRYGFIAQEVQAISDVKDNMGLVRAGKVTEDDPLYDAIISLCPDGVVNKSMMNGQQAVLISAIQELSAKVTALENA